MYNFNENNIITGYIKELLHNFNLPTCEVFLPNQTVVYPDTNYIYNDFLIRTRSSVEVGVYDDIIIHKNAPTDMADYVCPYVYGKQILGITKNLKLNTILYDTYTHEYLGNYLRFLRDFKGLDLLMLYNCFSNRLVTNLLYNDFDAEDLRYKIYAVPIKFDRKYLIGLESDSQIEIACGLFDDNIQVSSINTGKDAEENSLYAKSHKFYSSVHLNDPITFSIDSMTLDNNKLLKEYESCLVLFIKIPTQNKSTISIIETFGTASQFKQHIDGGVSDMVVPKSGVLDYPTKLSLFKINDNISYPFATRLLEYLFGQTIDLTEQIGDNIERVQLQLLSTKQYTQNGARLGKIKGFGVWSDSIRSTINKILSYKKEFGEASVTRGSTKEVFKQSANSKLYDLTGFVDKDVEELITVIANESEVL